MLPGVLGGICLLIALYAFQLLPINYAGIALILLGIAFIVAEAFMPSFGALGIGGVAAFAIGMVILIDPDDCAGLRHSAVVHRRLHGADRALAVFATAWLALKARRQPVVSGREDLHGAEARRARRLRRRRLGARARRDVARAEARCRSKQGERVRVTGVCGTHADGREDDNRERMIWNYGLLAASRCVLIV